MLPSKPVDHVAISSDSSDGGSPNENHRLRFETQATADTASDASRMVAISSDSSEDGSPSENPPPTFDAQAAADPASDASGMVAISSDSSDDGSSGCCTLASPSAPRDVPVVPCALLSPGDWGDIWNMEQSEHRYTLDVRFGTRPPLPSLDASPLEVLASVVCSRGWCDLSHLAFLGNHLPDQRSAKRRRHTSCSGTEDGQQRVFSVGAYSIGGFCGIQVNSRTFPWATRWLCSLINGTNPRHHFSSCTVMKDVLHFLHRDRGNDARSVNLLMPLSKWRGGQLWTADDTGSVHLDNQSGPGRLMTICLPYITMEPHTPHATFPWGGGSRLLLVAHHAGGLHRLPSAEVEELVSSGFHLLQRPRADVPN